MWPSPRPFLLEVNDDMTRDRRKKVMEYKAQWGCESCGESDPRRLTLVRPERTGVHLSRLLVMGSVSDEALWEEISRRIVVCLRCERRRRSKCRL